MDTFFFEITKSRIEKMVSSKKMRNDKLNTEQFFIYHFYDSMFFIDWTILLRNLARSSSCSIQLFNSENWGKINERTSQYTVG